MMIMFSFTSGPPLLPQLRHSQNFFTTGLVSHDNGYPSLTCKAYNGRVFLVFLTTCPDALLNQIGDDQEVTLAFSTSKATCVSFDRIERYGRYLTIWKPGICMMHYWVPYVVTKNWLF